MEGAKRGFVRAMALALAMLAACAVVFGSTGAAYAVQGDAQLAAGNSVVAAQADEVDVPRIVPEILWAGGDDIPNLSNYVENLNEWDDASIVKVKSSNTKVIKLVKKGNFLDYNVLHPKAGKSTVSITYKKDGMTKTIKAVFTVKKRPNVIKSLTFNGKKMSFPTKKDTRQDVYSFKGKKAAVKVVPVAGWKLKDASLSCEKYSEGAYEPDSITQLKNGKAFSLAKKKSAYITFTLAKKRKDGVVEEIECGFGIHRNNPLALRNNTDYFNTIYIGFPVKAAKTWIFLTDSDEASIYKVTSSNKRVLKATAGKAASSLKLVGKKAGKSTVTIRYKYKGKKYSTKATYTVAAYPVASITLNGKKLKLTGAYDHTIAKYKKNTAKLKVTPSKGWKVANIEYMNPAWMDAGDYVKNGASIKTPKGAPYDASWSVTLKSTKSSGKAKEFHYTVYINRV